MAWSSPLPKLLMRRDKMVRTSCLCWKQWCQQTSCVPGLEASNLQSFSYTPLPSSLSICLFHSLSLPAKHLRPSLPFLITMATCCLKSKRSSDLGLSNSFLILTLRKCTNYRRQLSYIALWSVYICHHNQTNTCEWAAPRMQSPSPVIGGPATKFTPNISLLLSMANFHIFWQ